MRSAYGAKEIGIGEHEVTIIVDVANVMGSRPDGWWRDRAGAAVRLHGELVRLGESDHGVPPGETDPPDSVMLLEGAAKAAAGRLSAASPADSPPGEATPGEAQPGEAQPGEAQPGEAQPGEAQPG